jgi:hypothetical protein
VVEAMREVLGVCNQAALPYLIPELIKAPMSVFHARALASLSDSFGHSFHRYVSTVTESLVQAISESKGARLMPLASYLLPLASCLANPSRCCNPTCCTDTIYLTRPREG